MKLLHTSFFLLFSIGSQFVFAANQLVMCEDPEACNFGLDEPCVYADLGYDCEGNCIQDVDEDGICDECEPFDLESPDIWVDCFCNFDEYVVEYWTVEEETCTLIFDCDCECINDEDGDGICDEILGCTIPSACNFNPEAVIDDGSCCTCASGDDTASMLVGGWKLSTLAGAIAIGPEPGSTEWYASPADGLVDFQYDDRWFFDAEGNFSYETQGSIMNPYEGFVETQITFEPSTYNLEVGLGFDGQDLLTIGDLMVGEVETCGWLGVWNSGPNYSIVELTDDLMIVSSAQRDLECCAVPGGGYFTLIFERVTFLDECPFLGCIDESACNFDPLAAEDDGSCLYVGDPCDDGDAATTADAISENCECEGTTGVEDLTMAHVVVFPNPASDLLMVDIQGRHGSPISLKLKDSTGRVVHAQMAMNQSLLDVSSLSEGLYLLDIEFAGFTVTKQVAIRH